MLIRSWKNREIQVDNGSCNAENDSQINIPTEWKCGAHSNGHSNKPVLIFNFEDSVDWCVGENDSEIAIPSGWKNNEESFTLES